MKNVYFVKEKEKIKFENIPAFTFVDTKFSVTRGPFAISLSLFSLKLLSPLVMGEWGDWTFFSTVFLYTWGMW